VSQPATNVLLKVAPKGDKLRKSLRSLLNSKGWRKRVGWAGFIHPLFVIKVPHLSAFLKKNHGKKTRLKASNLQGRRNGYNKLKETHPDLK